MNNNQKLIEGLRQAADFLEATPDLPAFGKQALRLWTWRDLDLFREAVRHLGTFSKAFNDNYLELHRPFGQLELIVTLDREAVCKKIVTWECPDDESLLKLVAEEEAKGAL